MAFLLAVAALVAVFVALNVAVRFQYTIEGEHLVARRIVLGVVPFPRKKVKLTKIASIERFSWDRDALRYFNPLGRPFSQEGTMIRFSGLPVPLFVSPENFEEFRSSVLRAREAILTGGARRA